MRNVLLKNRSRDFYGITNFQAPREHEKLYFLMPYICIFSSLAPKLFDEIYSYLVSMSLSIIGWFSVNLNILGLKIVALQKDPPPPQTQNCYFLENFVTIMIKF
jgi:hypothetical protein